VTALDFRTVVDASHLVAMGHGRVVVTVRSENAPRSPILAGQLTPRITCETLEAALIPVVGDQHQGRNGGEEEDSDEEQGIELLPSNGHGLAWMTVDTNGQIHFWIK